MRNKILLGILIVAFSISLAAPALVSADVDAGGYDSGLGLTTTQSTEGGLTVGRSFTDILGAAARWVMTILTSVAVVMFVVAGIMYVTAGGNEEQVEKAKKIITYAIIGLVIALVGFLIVEVVSGIASQTEVV